MVITESTSYKGLYTNRLISSKNKKKPYVHKRVSESAIIFFVLYIDDILLIENDIPMLISIKRWLPKEFSINYLGEAFYILGIKVYRNRSKRMLSLSQKLYIEKLLKRFSMKNSKKELLSLRHGIHLFKMMCPTTSKKGQHMSRIPYASDIRSLMYAILCT